jgi:serine/threonine protein kinase
MTERVGPYQIVRQIGRGGMAVVYLARQPALARSVALKELSPFHVRDESLARRFLREARVAGSLNHPNVVTVFDFIEQDGRPYIAMEYLERGSLRPSIGKLSVAQAAGVLEGLLAALSHAESVKIVHRDVKPENLLVTTDGAIKIGDFGIAKAYQQVATEEMLTPAGATVGTPAYMAPEQAMAQEIGPWTDLYQTGVVAFELFTGDVPFHAEGAPMAMIMKHISEPVPAMPDGTDASLEGWVRRLLAKDPAERPASAREAWEELEEIILGVLGPLWRRDARLGEPDPTVEHSLPLSPARFSSWQDYVPSDAAARPAPPPPRAVTPPPPVTPQPAPAAATPPPTTPPPEAPPTAAEPPAASPPPEAPPTAAEPPAASPPREAPPTDEPPATATPPPEEPPAAATPPPTEPPLPTVAPRTPPDGGRPTVTLHRSRRRAPLIVAGLVAVVLIVVAVIVFAPDGDDPPVTPTPTATAATPTPTPTATVAAGPFPIGDGPDGIAVGEGAVWVAASRDGTLTRIDPQTGDTTSVDVGENPDSVLVALGEVWVSLSGQNEVARVSADPDPEVLERIPVGAQPEGLSASSRAIWVANAGDGTVTQILADSSETRTVSGVGGQPVDLAVGAGAVWVADATGDRLVRVNGGQRVPVGSVTGIGSNPRSVVIVGRDVWVATADDGRVWRIDADANQVVDNVRVGGQPRDVTTDGEHLWVTDRTGNRVVEIDAASGEIVKRTDVAGGPLEVAVDDSAVWVSGFDSGEVTRLPR